MNFSRKSSIKSNSSGGIFLRENGLFSYSFLLKPADDFVGLLGLLVFDAYWSSSSCSYSIYLMLDMSLSINSSPKISLISFLARSCFYFSSGDAFAEFGLYLAHASMIKFLSIL
jgi:hypothetical protein